jgi:hypothetical protein
MDFKHPINNSAFASVAALSVLMTLGGTSIAAGQQGTATRSAAPVAAGKPSGKPFRSRFTDVAAEAGLNIQFVFGDDAEKRYLIEANGGGVAFVDFDGDGWLDVLRQWFDV